MAHMIKSRAASSFTAMIDRLEQRYVHGQNLERDEDEDSDENGLEGEEGKASKRKKPKSKRLKPTKEEEEWIREGEGFIDDSELIEDEEDVDDEESVEPADAMSVDGEAKPGDNEAQDMTSTDHLSMRPSGAAKRNKFMAVRVGDSNLGTSKGQSGIYTAGQSESRDKFLAQYSNEWVPPVSVSRKLFALEQAVKAGFATAKDWNARRRKGLGSIEDELLRVDKSARRALPDGKRTMGYIAKLVAIFPSPFTRGKVVAHLQRAILKRSLRDKERELTKRTIEAQEALRKRLQEARSIAEPPPPNLSTGTLAALDRSPLSEGDASFDDPEVLSLLETLTLELQRETPSRNALRELLLLLDNWAYRALDVTLKDKRNTPLLLPDAFVACREKAEELMRTERYFKWDGPTRAAVWRLGEACRACARARAKLDAWVLERSVDLLLGCGEGPAKNYRPRYKPLKSYLEDAERELITGVFRVSVPPSSWTAVGGGSLSELEAVGRNANIMRALCENPSNYYFVDENGDFVALKPPASPSAQAAEAQDSMEVSPGGEEIPGPEPLGGQPLQTSQSPGTLATLQQSGTVPGGADKDSQQQDKGSDYYAPSRGRRFQKITVWRMDDFVVGGFVSSDANEDKGEGGPGATKDGTKEKKTGEKPGKKRSKPGPKPEGDAEKAKSDVAEAPDSETGGKADAKATNEKENASAPAPDGAEVNAASTKKQDIDKGTAKDSMAAKDDSGGAIPLGTKKTETEAKGTGTASTVATSPREAQSNAKSVPARKSSLPLIEKPKETTEPSATSEGQSSANQ